MGSMTHTEAMEWVRRMRIAAQRCRSTDAENGIGQVLGEMVMPWLYGNRNILKAIAMIEERGLVTPLEFLNLMRVVAQCQPSIGTAAVASGLPDFPAPATEWLRGWEPESDNKEALCPT